MVCKSDSLSDLATLKKVVKSVAQDEDRSRNVVILGLSEKKEENVKERVKEVSEGIGLTIRSALSRYHSPALAQYI